MSIRQEMIIICHCVIWRKNYYLFIFCFAFLQKDIVYVPLSCPKYVFVTSDTVTPSVTLSGWREGRGKGVWGVWKSGWNGFCGAADVLHCFFFFFFVFRIFEGVTLRVCVQACGGAQSGRILVVRKPLFNFLCIYL